MSQEQPLPTDARADVRIVGAGSRLDDGLSASSGSGYKGLKGWFFRRNQKKLGGAVPSANRLTLLRDADGDGVAETRSVLVSGLSWNRACRRQLVRSQRRRARSISRTRTASGLVPIWGSDVWLHGLKSGGRNVLRFHGASGDPSARVRRRCNKFDHNGSI
jgi:hypothetical protein